MRIEIIKNSADGIANKGTRYTAVIHDDGSAEVRRSGSTLTFQSYEFKIIKQRGRSNAR